MSKQNNTSYLKNDSKSNSKGKSTNSNISYNKSMKGDNILGNSNITSFFKNDKEGLKQNNIQLRNNQVKENLSEDPDDKTESESEINKINNDFTYCDCSQVNEIILKFFTEKEIDSYKKSHEILLKLLNLNEYECKVYVSLIYNQSLLNEDEESYVRKVNLILQRLFYNNDISEYVSYINSYNIGRKIYDYNGKLFFLKSFTKNFIENYEFSRLAISDISNTLSDNQKHCLSDRSLLKKAISMKSFEFIQKFTLTAHDFLYNFTNIINEKDEFLIKSPSNPDLEPLMESLEYINEDYNEYKFINLIIQTYSLSIMTYPELIDIIRKVLIEYTEVTFEIIKEDETEKEKYYNLSKKLELKQSQSNTNSKIDSNYEDIIIKNEEEISKFIKSLNFSLKLEELINILENNEKSNEEKLLLSEKIILYSNNNSINKYNGRISFNINEEKLNFIIRSMIKSVNGKVDLSDNNDDIEISSEDENENNLDWELIRVLSVKDSINQIIQNIKEDYSKGIISLSENIIVNECFKRFNSIVNTLSLISNQSFKCYLGIVINPTSNDIRIICIDKEKLDEVMNHSHFCIERLVDIVNNTEIEFIREEYLIFNYLYEKDMLDTQTLEIKKGYIETVKKIKYFIEKYNPDMVYIIGKPYKSSKLYERIVNIYKKEVYYIDYSLVEVFINSLLSRIEMVSQVGQSKHKHDYLSKLSLIVINYHKKVLIMTYIPNFNKNPLRNYEFSYLQSYLSEESKNILYKKIEFVIYLYKQYEKNEKMMKFDISIIDNSNDPSDNISIIKIVNSQNFNTICFELESIYEGILLNNLQLIGVSNDLFFYSNLENSFVVKGNSKKQVNVCSNEGFYIGRIKKINKLKGNIEISQNVDDILNHDMFFNTIRENLKSNTNSNTNQISIRNHSYISILNNSIFLYKNYIINQPKPELKLQKRLFSSWLKKYYIDKTFCQLSKEASLIQFGEVFFRPSPLGNIYITLSIVLKNCMIMNVHIKESIKLDYLQEVGKGLLTYSSDKFYNYIEDFYEIFVYKTVDYLKKVVSNQNFSLFNDILSVQRELINCQTDDNQISFKFYILIPGYVTLGLCIPNSRIWFVHFLINENGFNLINILKINEYAENIFNFYCGNQYESIDKYVIKVFDSLDFIISFLKSDENSLIFKNAYECTAYTSLLYCPYHIYIDESNINEIEIITENIVPIRKDEENKKKGMNPPPSKEIYKSEFNQSSLVQHDEKELQSFKSGRSYLTKCIPTDNIFSEMEKMGNEYEEFTKNYKRNDDLHKNIVKKDNEGWGWDENKSGKENTSVKNNQFSNIGKSNLTCNYCKEEGHIIKECVKLQNKKKKENNNERRSNDDNSKKDFTGFKREQSSNFNNRNDTWGNDFDNKGNNKSEIKVEASCNNQKNDDDDWGNTQIVYKKEENNEIKEDDNDSWGKPTVAIKQNTEVNKEDNRNNDNWGGGSSFQNQNRNFNNKDNNRRDNFNNRDNNFKPKPNNKCFNCNEEGHRANECTKPRQERPKKSFACFNCNKEGHRISDCPEPRQERKRNFNNDNTNTYNNSNRFNRDNFDNHQPRGGYNKQTSGNNNDSSNKGWEWDENDNSNKNTNFNENNESDKGKSKGNDDWDTVFTNLNANNGEKINNTTKEDGEW